MFSLQNKIIVFIGLIAVIYCLIKAFVSDKLDNNQICLLLFFIMLPIIFIYRQTRCPASKELFQVTDPPVTSSIYPGPPNQDPILGKVNIPPPLPESATDLDIKDFKDILPINKKIYDNLVKNEEIAKNKIRATFTNEMVFTETNPLNTIPLGTQLYGYTYLPPENWFRAYDRPPVCISDTRPVMEPILDGNSTKDLLEFDTLSNINTMRQITPKSIRKKIYKIKTKN